MTPQTLVTHVTDKGYILLPFKFRKKLSLAPRQPVKITLKEKGLELKPLLSLDEVFRFVKKTKRDITTREMKNQEKRAHMKMAQQARQTT